MFEEGDLDDIENNLFASLRSSKPSKKSTAGPDSKKKLFEINDDDLLDLLSDGEGEDEEVSKTKKKGSFDFVEPKENKTTNNMGEESGEDEAMQFGSYVPTSSFQTTPRSQSILRTSNTKSELTHRRSSVHFSDRSPAPSEPLPTTSVPNTDPLNNDQSILSTPLTNTNTTKPIVSLTPMLPPVNTTPSANVPVTKPVTSVPVASTRPATSVPVASTKPVTSVPFASTRPVTSVPVTSVPVTKPVTSGPVLSTVEAPLHTSLVADNREEPTEEDNNGGSGMLFGSYIPSSSPQRGSRRRQSILNMSGNNGGKESSPARATLLHSSLLPVASSPLTTSEPSATFGPIAPTTTQSTPIVPFTSTPVSPVTNQPVLNTVSPIATTHHPPVLPSGDQMSSTPQKNFSALTETNGPPPTLTDTIFSPRSGGMNLEKQLRKYKEQLEVVTTEKEQSISQLHTLQLKLSEVEKEKDALSRSLEEARTSLRNEHESKWNENQAKERQLDQLKRELEESFNNKEQQLKKKLSNVIESHKEEVAVLKQEHEASLSQWKEMLSAEQREKREEMGRLQEQQQKLMESLSSTHSEGSRNNTSLQRMVKEISDGVQQTARQMSEVLSKVSSSQPPQQTIEVLCDRVAKRQEEEWLQPLVLRMEQYLGEKQEELSKEKASLSQLQLSLSSERKQFEEERTKLLSQVQHEREALLKSKEQFFSEQQAWLSDHYTEKHHIMRLQTIANETFTRNQKLETELSHFKTTLDQDRTGLMSEQSRLLKEKQELEQDRVKLNHERQALLNLQQNLKVQSVQVSKTSQMAQEVHMEGHQALAATQRMHGELNQRRTELKREQQKLISQKSLEADNINAHNYYENKEGHMVSSWLQEDDHTSLVMSQLEVSQSMRDLIKEAKQDDETLEEEIHFLHKIKMERQTK